MKTRWDWSHEPGLYRVSHPPGELEQRLERLDSAARFLFTKLSVHEYLLQIVLRLAGRVRIPLEHERVPLPEDLRHHAGCLRLVLEGHPVLVGFPAGVHEVEQLQYIEELGVPPVLEVIGFQPVHGRSPGRYGLVSHYRYEFFKPVSVVYVVSHTLPTLWFNLNLYRATR